MRKQRYFSSTFKKFPQLLSPKVFKVLQTKIHQVTTSQKSETKLPSPIIENYIKIMKMISASSDIHRSICQLSKGRRF